MSDGHRARTPWRLVLSVATVPLGILALMAGGLLFTGGIVYYACGWIYGSAIAWWAGSWGLGLAALGALLLAPYRGRAAIVAVGLGVASAGLFGASFAVAHAVRRPELLGFAMAAGVILLGAAVALLDRRRARVGTR